MEEIQLKVSNEIISQFLSDCNCLSDNSLINYGLELKRFFNFINKPYDQVKSEDIKTWLNSLYEAGYTSGTIATKYTRVRSFYKYCAEEDLVCKDPFDKIKRPDVDDKLPSYLNREQMNKLRELIKDNEKESAIVETLYTTGIRVTELTNIKLSDIDWDCRKIKIMGKGKKGRFVLFTNNCEIRLKEYLNSRNDTNPYLFIKKFGGEKMVRRSIERLFVGYKKKLGFTVTPHTLRHTFAVCMAEKEMPINCIQNLLGHESMLTTKIYTRLCKHAQKMAYDKFY